MTRVCFTYLLHEQNTCNSNLQIKHDTELYMLKHRLVGTNYASTFIHFNELQL